MNLIIVESPSKAKTISKYLGTGYSVIASYGHIFEIPSEKGSIDTENDFKVNYKPSSKQLTTISENAKKADKIYLASDPDREGEGIAWEINEYLKSKKITKNIYRITYSEITKKAILEAIENARQIDSNLVNAQQSRATLDYLVGFNVSPVLWKKLSGAKSAGRVQSAALRLISERELEISAFIPKEYWTIDTEINNDKSEMIETVVFEFNEKKFSNTYPSNKKQADEVLEILQNKSSTIAVKSNESKEVSKKPLPPFITSTLQQDALNKFGFNAKKTMQIAQKLYEGIEINGSPSALITYMRTDGTTIGQDALTQIRSFISDNYTAKYLPKSSIEYKTKVKNAQEAHEAIRPIDITKVPKDIENSLSKDEFELYSLIWARTVACQMANATQLQQSIIFEISSKNDKVLTKANASKITFDGYLKVYSDYQSTSNEEINFDEKAKLEIGNSTPKQHFTSPPARFNEGSLIKMLESLGIGRPSTFASIVSTLIERTYAEMEKKAVKPTNTGIITAYFLKNFFTKYVDYSFTAKLEDSLDEIANAKADKLVFLKSFWGDLTDMVKSSSEAKIKDIFEKITTEVDAHIKKTINKEDLVCEKCGTGKMQIGFGKYGYFLSCSNYPECKNIMNFQPKGEGSVVVEGQDGQLQQDPIFTDKDTKVFDKVGKYGRYLEVNIGDKKKNMAIPKDIELSEENIKIIIQSPLKIGSLDKNDVCVGVGKYGPYILCDKKFHKLPKGMEIYNVTEKDAIEIIKKSKK